MKKQGGGATGLRDRGLLESALAGDVAEKPALAVEMRAMPGAGGGTCGRAHRAPLGGWRAASARAVL